MYKSFIFTDDRLGINLNALKDEEGKIWFIGKEVAELLEYADAKKAIQRHVKKENHKRKITNNDINSAGYKTSPPKTKQLWCNSY